MIKCLKISMWLFLVILGYKASIGTSILKMNGYKNVTNLLGQYDAWKKAGYPVVKR